MQIISGQEFVFQSTATPSWESANSMCPLQWPERRPSSKEWTLNLQTEMIII